MFLLNEMALENKDFGPVLLDFHGFIHVLLTRWIYPPDHPYPFDVEAEVINAVFPDPPDDPAATAGQPAQVQSQPPSPSRTPPPVMPLVAQDMDPVPELLEPIYDPYGIHDHGYIDPLTLHLAPPSGHLQQLPIHRRHHNPHTGAWRASTPSPPLARPCASPTSMSYHQGPLRDSLTRKVVRLAARLTDLRGARLRPGKPVGVGVTGIVCWIPVMTARGVYSAA